MKQAKEIQVFELQNHHGAYATVLNLGARLTSLNIPTPDYGMINTLLGYKNPRGYLTDTMYHGAIVGRYCNRIAHGEIPLGNQRYQLLINDGHHHLHGGPEGFHQKIWRLVEKTSQRLHLQLESEDGEAGYPGKLTVNLYYELDDENQLHINWQAYSDKDTVVSLTNHSYFNLSGCADIYNHYLRIPADHYTPVNSEMIPSGEITPVEGTPYDLRHWTQLGKRLNTDHPGLSELNGFDHNWASGNAGKFQLRAELYSPKTELLLQVFSSLPGLQCYSGNNLTKTGIHTNHQGICLETQYYPDTPNNQNFPSARLKAGESMYHRNCFSFSRTSAEVELKKRE